MLIFVWTISFSYMSYKNNYLLKIEPWPRLTWVVNLDTECGLLFNYCITTLLSLLTRDSYHHSGNYITYSELHYVCIYILLPCLSFSIFLIPFDPSAERLTDDRLTHLNPWNPQLSIFKYVSSFCWTNTMKNNLQLQSGSQEKYLPKSLWLDFRKKGSNRLSTSRSEKTKGRRNCWAQEKLICPGHLFELREDNSLIIREDIIEHSNLSYNIRNIFDYSDDD